MSNILKRFFKRSRRASFFIPFAVVAGFAGMIIYNSVYETESQVSGAMDFSSKSNPKQYQYAPRRMGKHLAFVQASLESPESIPETAGRSLILKGKIILTQSSAIAAKYKWILPEGVYVVRGNIEGALDHTRVNVEQEVQIEVTGFDQTEKRVITLEARAKTNDQVYGATAVLSSRPQDSMEYLARDMKDSVDALTSGKDL